MFVTNQGKNIVETPFKGRERAGPEGTKRAGIGTGPENFERALKRAFSVKIGLGQGYLLGCPESNGTLRSLQKVLGFSYHQ